MENCETYFCVTGLEFKGTNPIDVYNDDESIDVNNCYDEAKWNGYTEYKRDKIRKQAKYFTQPNKAGIKVEARSDDKKIVKRIDYRTPVNSYYENRHDYAINMCYEQAAKKKIIINLPHRGIYTFKDIKIICQPMDEYNNQVNALKTDHLANVDFHYQGDSAATNEITGDISLKENKLVLVSIPYSEGWTAFVDGRETPILRANTMFSAVKVGKGEHKIKFTYTTPGLKIGLILTTAGCVAFICFFVFALIKRKKSRGKRFKKI